MLPSVFLSLFSVIFQWWQPLSDVRCSHWSFTWAELPVPPTAYVALSSMAAFVPCLKFMIFSDTESFTLLWELSCLSSTAAVCLWMLLVPLLLLQILMVLLHRSQRNMHIYTKMLLILEYCSRPAWLFFFFFQIHSVNLKITTCLSSSSAFLFDNCSSRTRQDDYLPDEVHKLTANRHVIYNEKTVSTCGKMHWRCCLFSISNETSFCFQFVLTYPQVGCLYIQHHLKCLCYHHCSISKSRSFSPVIWVLAGRWTYFEMEVLLNPWLILFILCLSLILFSKLLF